jgi:DNA modification methylase
MTAETLQADIAEDATLHLGDCLEVLRTLPDCSVDAVVTDPPYGLSFMGKKWDYDVPAVEVWAECLRVLKPGGHLLAFAGTRTQHRMAVRIEDAGFEIRDMIAWVYGSGFPKSLDVSKAIDKAAGAERTEIIGKSARHGGGIVGNGSSYEVSPEVPMLYAPATEAARQWQGWGTALKPALEPVTVARKPLAGTVAGNVLEHGTGALNIEGCRVPGEAGRPLVVSDRRDGNGVYRDGLQGSRSVLGGTDAGRWPANLIHDGSDEVVGLFPQAKSGGNVKGSEPSSVTDGIYGEFDGRVPFSGYADTGSAARFFYTAKASKADRDEGCEGLTEVVASVGNTDAAGRDGGNPNNYVGDSQRRRVEAGLPATMPRRNHHPTVKPTDLMRYLCRLVTPPGGTVLDPFMGSGSTGRAALLEGFRFIGIEREAQYLEIARARVQSATPALWR